MSEPLRKKEPRQLTDVQHQVLLFIDKYWKQYDQSPTQLEMADYFDRGAMTINATVGQLEAHGKIKRKPHQPRGLSVVDTDREISSDAPSQRGK